MQKNNMDGTARDGGTRMVEDAVSSRCTQRTLAFWWCDARPCWFYFENQRTNLVKRWRNTTEKTKTTASESTMTGSLLRRREES